jgi:hypothetical protein
MSKNGVELLCFNWSGHLVRVVYKESDKGLKENSKFQLMNRDLLDAHRRGPDVFQTRFV